MKIALLLLVGATLALIGCGASQAIVSGQAEVHAATQDLRFDFYAEEDARCGGLHPEDREAYRGCIREGPAGAVASAADAYREVLEAAQDLIDAGNEDGFTAKLAEVVSAARHLARALAVAGVDVPSEVGDLIALGE